MASAFTTSLWFRAEQRPAPRPVHQHSPITCQRQMSPFNECAWFWRSTLPLNGKCFYCFNFRYVLDCFFLTASGCLLSSRGQVRYRHNLIIREWQSAKRDCWCNAPSGGETKLFGDHADHCEPKRGPSNFPDIQSKSNNHLQPSQGGLDLEEDCWCSLWQGQTQRHG
jgi:hypothetical protein